MSSSLDGKWIEVFRVGDYGDKGRYTEPDLDALVRNFNPAQHEPPVVGGHPEDNAPAYGWVSGLKRMGGALFATLKQVPEKFAALVQSGRFKKRSVSFYTTPQGPVLRHLGFLGAMPPEVKGLADISFSDRPHVIIEYGEKETREETPMRTIAGGRIPISEASLKLADRATQIAKERRISFGEALQIARGETGVRQVDMAEAAAGRNTPVLPVSRRSVYLRDAAEKIAQRNKISFGEALTIARHELAANMSDDVVDPDRVGQTVESALRAGFARIMGSGQETIIDGTDTFRIVEAVGEELNKLNLGQSTTGMLKDELDDSLDDLIGDKGRAAVKSSDVDSTITRATALVVQAYKKELAALRS